MQAEYNLFSNCFYPRAREGRDLDPTFQAQWLSVSIRAPVKDATTPVDTGFLINSMFLSARP